jgi:hypothetical protein
MLTSAFRYLLFTSDSEEPPRLKRDVRMQESKWTELEEAFSTWSNNASNPDAEQGDP